MNADTFNQVIIMCNPVIIMVQAILYSRMMKNYGKLLEASYGSRWEITKEYFEYRNEVMQSRFQQAMEPMRNE